jgi:hypothetical protein
MLSVYKHPFVSCIPAKTLKSKRKLFKYLYSLYKENHNNINIILDYLTLLNKAQQKKLLKHILIYQIAEALIGA